MVVVPDADGGTAPDVALVVLHNIGDDEVLQGLGAGVGHGLVVLAAPHVESLLGADEDVALAGLAERVACLGVDHGVPSVGAERAGGCIEGTDARRSAYPHAALVVGHERHHPVVAQSAELLVGGLHHAVGGEAAAVAVVDHDALGEGREDEMAAAVVGHVVVAVAFLVAEQLRRALLRVVGIDAVRGAYPVGFLLVAVDEVDVGRSLRMGDDASLAVEAVDALVLDRGPDVGAGVIEVALGD